MSDLYNIVQFGYMNPNDDVIRVLKQDFNKEMPNDIREYEWNEQEDKFWDSAHKETKIVETIKNPKKNNRRINIPDAEIKYFHYRFNTEDERYNEHIKGDRTPIEDGYNQLPTRSTRDRQHTNEKVNER